VNYISPRLQPSKGPDSQEELALCLNLAEGMLADEVRINEVAIQSQMSYRYTN
jgi:hypothetical protein